jgi:hypothetical protein
MITLNKGLATEAKGTYFVFNDLTHDLLDQV